MELKARMVYKNTTIRFFRFGELTLSHDVERTANASVQNNCCIKLFEYWNINGSLNAHHVFIKWWSSFVSSRTISHNGMSSPQKGLLRLTCATHIRPMPLICVGVSFISVPFLSPSINQPLRALYCPHSAVSSHPNRGFLCFPVCPYLHTHILRWMLVSCKFTRR